MDVGSAFQTLAIALGLGLLVGMQRERVDAPLAGVRTFALITTLGTLAAILALTLGPWVVIAGLLGVTLVTVAGNLALRQDRRDSGITTEIAILLMYAVGAYLVFGDRRVGVVLGAGVAVLLHAKPVMHGFVKRLGEADMHAVMQFVLISLVILPVLPNQAYGPHQVLNPREIWWMVVLVVAINLLGYIALKLYGEQAGVVIAGLIGGLVSSTATTVGYARRASGARGQATAALLVMLASTVVYVRVLVEVLAVAPRRIGAIAPPIMVLLAVSSLISFALWWTTRDGDRAPLPHGNPTELKPALIFGALYAVVLLAVAAARDTFGNRGVYVAAGISGLTDMDAITLSTARMAAGDALPTRVAWRAIVIAIVSNLTFKLALVAALGGLAPAGRIALPFAIKMAVAIALLALWPG